MHTRLLPPAALLLPAAFLLLAALRLPAQELRVEAESYTGSRDLSQPPIRGVDNPSCSGGVSLAGLESPGEWTSYTLKVPAAETYSVSVHFRARAGKPVLMRLALAPAGQAAGTAPGEIELSLPGNGFG